MNKTICFLFLGVFMPSMLYSYPFVFQWYAPSLFDSSFGGTVYHQFEEKVESQILIPYETKFYLNKNGKQSDKRKYYPVAVLRKRRFCVTEPVLGIRKKQHKRRKITVARSILHLISCLRMACYCFRKNTDLELEVSGRHGICFCAFAGSAGIFKHLWQTGMCVDGLYISFSSVS